MNEKGLNILINLLSKTNPQKSCYVTIWISLQRTWQLYVAKNDPHNEMHLILTDLLRPPHSAVTSLEGSKIGLSVV